ncbi:MAG: NUDIX hydrolase [Prevotellaceae bacterium]|nr:NUDIX hydrolase [Prevotellaceae bacterium]
MMSDNERNDRKDKDMRWELLGSEYLFREPWLTARRDHVRLPSGAEVKSYYVLEYPDFCNIVALTKEGKMIMERQYRHAQRLTAYEIPAGCVEKGETPLQAARRELLEETGYVGGEWKQLTVTSPNASACTNSNYSFLAVGVEFSGARHLETTEDIEVHLMSEQEVFDMLCRDEIHQAMMVSALWKYFAVERNLCKRP